MTKRLWIYPNTDIDMPDEMRSALLVFEAYAVCSGISEPDESEVRAWLTERRGADFAADFRPEYLQ